MRTDRPLVIEDGVWIVHNVSILPRCKLIGRGAVIGASAIVTSDVERYSMMVGNSARKICDRFSSEVVVEIEASRWWDLSLDELREVTAADRAMAFNPTVGALRRWRTGGASPATQIGYFA